MLMRHTTVQAANGGHRSPTRKVVAGPFSVAACALVVCLAATVPSHSQDRGQSGGVASEGTPATAESAPPGITGGNAADPSALADQAANPAAPLTQIQIRDILLPKVAGTDGATNLLQLQPVVPIGPFKSLPFLQLVKITVQAPSLPGPVNDSGFGDVALFDLVSIKTSWGRWGFGPALVFPTAASEELGAGKWQAGAAVALIYTGTKNLTAGAVLQNPISFAGSSRRETGEATIPLGVQVGKVFTVGKVPLSLSIEGAYYPIRPDEAPHYALGLELNWVLPQKQQSH